MIPLSDENPTLRTPVVTIALLAALGLVWVFVQGAGIDAMALATSVCNLGLVPGELTGPGPAGHQACRSARGWLCLVDDESDQPLHPDHLDVPARRVDAPAGQRPVPLDLRQQRRGQHGAAPLRRRFTCCAGWWRPAAQVAVNPASPVPMVGASGAISGVLGAYLVLYPRVRVNVLFIIVIFIQVISVPAYLVLLWWIGFQILSGLPQLGRVGRALRRDGLLGAHRRVRRRRASWSSCSRTAPCSRCGGCTSTAAV